MALLRDYSLSKDLDIEANEEMINCISENYENYEIPGQHFKNLLKRYIVMYKGSCGQDEDINKIYDLLSSYSNMNVADNDYSYTSEASLIKNLFTSMDKYEKKLSVLNDELGSTIDKWLAKVNSESLSPEQRRQDIKYVGQVEQIMNRRLFIYEIKACISMLMEGALIEGYHEESSDMESMFTSMELPLTTHIPYYDDIDQTEFLENPVMQVLHNIVVKDSFFPLNMMHDYDNGNVCVRLWKKENDEYVPTYFSIIKSDVFLEKVSYSNQRAIWPGLIEQALKDMGLSDSKEKIAEAILGQELANFDIDFLCENKEMPKEDNTSEITNNAIDAYIKCVYDTYASFVSTNSLVVSDTLEYTQFLFSIKEFMYALSCSYNQSFDIMKPALELIKQYLAKFRQYASEQKLPTKQIAQRRLSICNTIDEIIALLESDSEYHFYPHLYFERFLAERVARTILNSKHAEINDQTVAAKIREVMLDPAFKNNASKLNIHSLRYPSAMLVDTILAKMERR